MYSFVGIWTIVEELLTSEVIAILRIAKQKQKQKQDKDSRWKQTTYFVVEQESAKQMN